MAPFAQSALALISAAALVAQSEAFGVVPRASSACVSTFAPAPSATMLLRAEGEGEAETAGDNVEASSAEGGETAAAEEEKKEDPEVTAIKEEIAEFERKIKQKRKDLSSIIDAVETYSQAGYARKVAEMDQIRKMRGAASKSNESTAKAAVLQDFLPVLDELVSLDAKYEGDEFATSYKALRWDLNNAMSALGMSEYTAAVGESADPTRVVAVEEQYSDDVAKGAVIAPVSVGFEINGNVMRMAECVISLGSEADAKKAEEDAAAAAGESTEEASA